MWEFLKELLVFISAVFLLFIIIVALCMLIWLPLACYEWNVYRNVTGSTCTFGDYIWCGETIKAMEIAQPRVIKEGI